VGTSSWPRPGGHARWDAGIGSNGRAEVLLLLADTDYSVPGKPVGITSRVIKPTLQIIDLTWINATPPFTAYIMYVIESLSWEQGRVLIGSPIYSRPFIYDIPDEAYSNGMGRYTVRSPFLLLDTSDCTTDRAAAPTRCLLHHVYVRLPRLRIRRVIRNPSRWRFFQYLLPQHNLCERYQPRFLILSRWKSSRMFERVRYYLE
jgi:hypothetical protein